MRLLHLFALLLAGVSIGCSGGGSSSSAQRRSAPCAGGGELCLVNCNLGCQANGSCAVSEIAQNQPIRLQFSEAVDPASVTSGSLSIKTANGESADGTLLIDGDTVVFQPEVRLVGGRTTFGFRANETYVLSLPADSAQSIRSRSGDRLSQAVLCSLSVTQGLIDLDGQPPRATLVSPASTTDVPVDTTIIIRMSELIDLGPFQNATTQTAPIIYRIRKTKLDAQNRVICDPEFEPILIGGVPIATVNSTEPQTADIALKPAIDLPNEVCVEVIVTDQVKDLAGRSAETTTFRFFTAAGTGGPTTLTETFSSDTRMDKLVSGGSWNGGLGIPAVLGGSGKHGSFDPNIGIPGAEPGTFLFNTDNQPIPAENTLFGEPVPPVTDGVFEFTDFVVPAGVKIIFRGSKPAVIRVRGTLQVDGELTVDGSAPPGDFDGTAKLVLGQHQPATGQDGAPGGAGGGAGGKGADGCEGLGARPEHSGSPGESLVAPATSGYAGQVVGTGGRGGTVFPTSGISDPDVRFGLFGSICGMVAGGGGGGSFLGGGSKGRAVRTFSTIPQDLGPDTDQGRRVDFRPLPAGRSVAEHFFVGGSGGGGGGSQPVNMSSNQIQRDDVPWHAGSGGTGGGGVLNVRVGGSVLVGANGVIGSRGGNGAEFTVSTKGPPAPGGGGSGGTVILQLTGKDRLTQNGTLDVRGGKGARLHNIAFNGQPVEAVGGTGGHGYIRVEARGGITAADVGKVNGVQQLTADNLGDLAASEEDEQSGFASLWRSTRQIFPPTFLHYRVAVRIGGPNGTMVVYSDDPDDFNPANQPGSPVRVYFQGGVVNAASNQLEGPPGPWREFVSGIGAGAGRSLNEDNPTGFRFMVLFDRTVAKDVAIEEVQVTFR